MDVDNPNTPTSRDPRLVSRNRPAPARTASLDAGIWGSPNGYKLGARSPNDPPPIDRQDEAPGDQFIRTLSELIKAAVDTAAREVEKDKLLKKKDMTEGLLRKAKAAPNFPSTTAFFQQARKDEDSELTRMDETISRHQAHYRQLENSLTTKWVPLLLRNHSDSDQKINKLQDEIRALKKRAGDSESGASREKYQLLETKMKMLQDRVVLLEKTSDNYATSINTQMRYEKENKERVDKLSSDIAQFASQETILKHFSTEVEGLKRITIALDAKLSSLQRAQEEYSGSLGRVNEIIDAQRKRLDASNDNSATFEKKFKEIHERLAPIEKVHVIPPEGPATVPIDASKIELRLKNVEDNLAMIPRPDSSLRSTVQNLSEQLQQLQSLQAMKDEFHFAEMEEIKKSTVDKADIQSLKDNYSRLADETRRISQLDRAGAVGQAEIQSLKDSYSRLAGEIQKIQSDRAIAVDKAEIQSLKETCSRLAENIQKMSQWNPAAALQQIHTVDVKINTVDAALKSSNRLLESVRVGLHSLETRYNHLSTEMVVKNMVVAMQEMYPSAGQLTEQITTLKNQAEKEISSLKKTIEQLVQTQNSQKALVNCLQDDVGQRSAEITHLRDLFGKVAHQVSALTEQLEEVRALPDKKGKEVADGQNRIELNESFRELKDQVQNLSSGLNQMKVVMSEITLNKKDLQSLDDRFRCLEESVPVNHRVLSEQINTLKDSLETHKSIVQALDCLPASGMQSLKREQSPSGSDAAPHTNFVEMTETNPALALREKKRKKKRPRPPTLSDNENERSSGSRNESPMIFSSPAHTLDNEVASPSENKRKTKKKKKRRLITEGPITID
ncbi:hypothetical protein KXV68_001191 [Aspergillus fumigatus]|nr:hypothetical protein KXX67_001269 [Aspergillus fumigatus]KAH1685666.1 hypothetical protein KXX23_005782 [Aspergillus fumigatus]KAH1712404.1 hypothetical protein KXX40_005806 [Aspergillus fumigatus]KAH1727265.1 hypothetical protein KXX25_008765 [Aspergillus fumigatus]KAH1930033.1 hypothetical protein KXV48_001450 [Aspergillus fumigatus]